MGEGEPSSPAASSMFGADLSPLLSQRPKLRLNPSRLLSRVQLRKMRGLLLRGGLQANMERRRVHTSAHGLSFPPKSFETGGAAAFEGLEDALKLCCVVV
jgi:hypothetical protein